MSPGKTNVLQIKTPEGIAFSQLLASPVTRMLAWVVDLLLIMSGMMLLSYGILFLTLLNPDLASAFQILLWFVLPIAYGILCEWLWRGQTLGKKLLRLRVVDAEGLRLTFNQVVIRNLLRFVDSLPVVYLVGGVVCLFSQRSQRLGDIAANTIVIRIPKLSEPDLDQILTGKFNSLRQYPHVAARLRQRVSPAEAALALQAVLRRNELTDDARVQLFAELTAHFSHKVTLPSDATEGITDEQFVRNIVDVLYRSGTGGMG